MLSDLQERDQRSTCNEAKERAIILELELILETVKEINNNLIKSIEQLDEDRASNISHNQGTETSSTSKNLCSIQTYNLQLLESLLQLLDVKS